MPLKTIPSKRTVFVYLLGFYFLSLVLGALNLGAFGSLLRVVALLPVAWWFLFCHRVTFNRVTLVAVLFLGFSALSCAWSILPLGKALVAGTTPFLLLVLLLASSGYSYTEKDIRFLQKALVWSSRITALVLLVLHNQLASRLTLSEGSLQEDPNYLCSYFLFGIVYAVEQILTPRKSHKLFYVAELGLYLLVIFATGSRGGMLAIVMALAVAGCGQMLKNKISLKTVLLPLLLVGGIGLTLFILPHFLPESVLDRFSAQSIVESKGTGRYQLWKNFLYLYADSPLWRQLIGYGGGSSLELARISRMVKANVTHNIWVEYLISFGALGVLFYLTYLWQFIRMAWRREIFALAVFIGMLTFMLSTSYQGKAFWNILIYLVCLSKLIIPPKDSAR